MYYLVLPMVAVNELIRIYVKITRLRLCCDGNLWDEYERSRSIIVFTHAMGYMFGWGSILAAHS